MSATPLSDRALLLVTTALALAFLAWEATPGDAWLAGLAGSGSGFALRDDWFLTQVMHIGARNLAWVLVIALVLAVRWPVGPMRAVSRARRLQLAGSVLLTVLCISLLKSVSPAACPWDLTAYGGAVQPVSHWHLWAPAAAGGRCFPAGHASAGFAFLGGYFVFRDQLPVLARRWLVAALAAGLLLGLTQQWRGAHFMSHTLWSGWFCWCLAWAIDLGCRRWAPSARPILETA